MQMTNKQKGIVLGCAAALFLVTVSVSGSFDCLAANEDGAKSSIEKNQLLTGKGKGHGPGNGTGNGGSGPKDGSGYGPGDCTTQAVNIDSQRLFVGRGNGSGNGGSGGQGDSGRKGPGDGTGTCVAS